MNMAENPRPALAGGRSLQSTLNFCKVQPKSPPLATTTERIGVNGRVTYLCIKCPPSQQVCTLAIYYFLCVDLFGFTSIVFQGVLVKGWSRFPSPGQVLVKPDPRACDLLTNVSSPTWLLGGPKELTLLKRRLLSHL